MKDRDVIYKVLSDHRYMTMATASTDGKPEAATIGYVLDKERLLIQCTKPTYRKLPNLRSNPQVACVITKDHDYTLQFDCQAIELGDDLEKSARNKMLKSQPELAQFFTDTTAFFELVPYWMRLRVYKNDDDSGPKEYVYMPKQGEI